MQILFISNFYPPAGRGGYEQWCREVANQLTGRGHQLTVLTSRHGRDQINGADAAWVHRDLYLEMELASLRNGLEFFTARTQREQANLTRLNRLVADVTPDAAVIWGMWNLPRSVAARLESLLPGRVIYYLGDYWPTLPSQHQFYWQAPAKNLATALPKRFLAGIARRQLARETRPALKFEHALFPTAFLKDELTRRGFSARHTAIVPGAIDTSLYPFRNGQTASRPSLSLLYVGRLVADKGVHTAIEALGRLAETSAFDGRLTIVGDGEPEYETHLRKLVDQYRLQGRVTFAGPQPQTAIPAFYAQADVLLFTSIWPEPFGRVLVEAMAAGVAVVGSAVGGAAEIMTDNHNALTFAPDDAGQLAAQLLRLADSPELLQRLTQTARQTAIEKYDISAMTTDLENYLQQWVVN